MESAEERINERIRDLVLSGERFMEAFPKLRPGQGVTKGVKEQATDEFDKSIAEDEAIRREITAFTAEYGRPPVIDDQFKSRFNDAEDFNNRAVMYEEAPIVGGRRRTYRRRQVRKRTARRRSTYRR